MRILVDVGHSRARGGGRRNGGRGAEALHGDLLLIVDSAAARLAQLWYSKLLTALKK